MILDLADERGYAPSTAEVRTLLEAVGDGAAIAASEYVRRREADLLQRESEHAAFLAHELRNSLNSARFAFDLLRRRDFAASNAVKFSRPGGTVTLRVAIHGGYLKFEVADSCGGLDEGASERLFRPFVQASSERSGFGLGLAIARECAESQGGSLELRNVPEHGCVFTLTIPVQP